MYTPQKRVSKFHLQEEEADARKARAAAAAEGRKEREAGRRKALARKTPVTAIMSQQQRARVEDVLAQLRDTHLPGSPSTSGAHVLLLFCLRAYLALHTVL